ncbi:MAG: cohesin domain-containing protein, partial [Methanoregula sp.]|nr:cohesin domain-containing protein [Methanoregula sp.]
LANGDQVNFYYGTKPVTPVNATAVLKITVNIPAPGPVVDTLFNGTVYLAADSNVSVTAYNTGTSYTINATTPLGALSNATKTVSLPTNITDKSFATKGILMLDGIGNYLYNKSAGLTWICQVNGVTLDDYGSPATDGLNLKGLANGDQVNFYYGPKPVTPANATAVLKIKVQIGGTPPAPDWSLSLKGARSDTITKSYFESALACSNSGHMVNYTDADGNNWSGIPLWFLVGIVDDNPDVGPLHYNFNDSIAEQGYSIKVTGNDGYAINFESADIAHSNGYIVANRLNGQPLPELRINTTKPCYPLQMIGVNISAGKLVGSIKEIELVGLPTPSKGWTLHMDGEITDTISQQYFEQGIVCHHNVTYTDTDGTVWTGVPLWDLVGAVDDIETTSHWTFNDTLATEGYTVRVSAGDGFNTTFASAAIAHNNSYIVANTANGVPLTGSAYPLKLVGPMITSGKQKIGNISRISLEGIPTPFAPGDWNLSLQGAIGAVIPQTEYEYWATCHEATYTDANGNVWTGVPLWRLMGWVDDRIPHGQNGFNDALATAGYKVIVTAGDGYSKEFTSTEIGKTNNFLVANRINGTPLSKEGAHPPYPLRLVGAGVPTSSSVGNIVKIELTDFSTPVAEPQLRVIKYASDQTTILSEVTVNATWMEQNLAVIGDGTTVYKFEGITGNPADVWDANETYPGGYKISNAVKGTKIKDLVELVGGMGSGTDVKLIASDNYETTLPYSSIYTNPAVQTRQGDAILSWWSDGSRVPAYADAYRLYFTPGGDHVYGQWDMHETLPETYWHYYFDAETKYPSCAGLSGKLVRTIKVYSVPAADWTLVLDGRDIGGLSASISKNYFDQALACQFGAEHEASYTDSKGRVWAGIPLWFLAGYVDDADQHSSKSFNDSKALAGYSIVITAKDGYNATVDSRLMIRTSNYIVANSLNGTAFAGTDENFPLRMAGQNITGGLTVKQIASIKLLKSENPFPSGPTLYVPSSVQPPGSSRKGIVQVMNLSQAAGIGVNLQYDPAVMYITDISLNNTLSDASLYTTIDNTTGMVKIAITMTDPVTIPDSSGIVDLTFRAIGATNATTVLAASRAEWTDATFTNKSFAVVQGNFRVTMKGDFNGNGYVDTGDVSRVAWMVVGRTYELIPDADFNNNGVVDIGDAAKIAWYYVKKIPDL